MLYAYTEENILTFLYIGFNLILSLYVIYSLSRQKVFVATGSKLMKFRKSSLI